MSWREELRPASWRGVPFKVADQGMDGGRRAAVHEFPGRRLAQADDLGAVARSFSLDAYLIGDDYLQQAERLEDALDEAGAGVLVIPYTRPRRCQVLRWGRRDSIDHGGLARFSLSFLEVEPDRTLELPDFVAQAKAAATALGAAGKQGLLARLLEKGVPEFVREAIGKGALGVVKAIGAVPILTAANEGFELILALNKLSGPAQDGSLSAELGADAILGAIPLIGPVFGNGVQALSVLERVMRAPRPKQQAQGAMGIQAEVNEIGVLNFASLVAAGEAVAIASEVSWQSNEEAQAWRGLLDGLIAGLLPETDDKAWDALQELRAALAAAVPPSNRRLPRVAVWIPDETSPAELIAYQVYGSAGPGLDLARRNRIQRPLAVPPKPLEILVP